MNFNNLIIKIDDIMYIERMLTERLKKLFATFPAVVVTGARQVGKSTLVAHVFGMRGDTVVFDPVQDVENARRDPELFLNNHRLPLILDEIQYAPELVPAIKRRIDRDRVPGQYILTGSQQWGVLKSIVESLAGRAVFLDLHGFALAEIVEPGACRPWLPDWLKDPKGFLNMKPFRQPSERSLYEQLWRGWMPEAQRIPLDVVPDFYQAYQRTYIERDVRLQADVSDLQLFGRFLRLCAALTAQEVNYSQLGRDLGVNPQTARHWLGILKAGFQWFEIPAFTSNLIKRLSSKPKGYIADTGLACFAQAVSTPNALGGHPLWGALFETGVVMDICKQYGLMSPAPNLFHWRSYGGAEVDLLVERDGVFFPIEIKASSNPSRRDTSGITAFRKTFPRLEIEKGLVLAPVDAAFPLSEQDYALPWDLTLAKND